MRNPYTQLYVHLAWATWDRLPFLTNDLKEKVYACIKSECVALGAEALAIGGTEDHVHVLARIPTTAPIALLVKQMKGSSSHLVTHVLGVSAFKWQGAYAAFTVSKSLGRAVRDYIAGQEQHHAARTTDQDMELPPDVPGE
ncbi:MAG: transposase [Armatimonadota bacterium]|nr:transposase [Armatimonadota bacterium]